MASVAHKRFIVYALKRPDGRPFYVGKGSRRRPHQHISEARREECCCRKCVIIRDIEYQGGEIEIEYLYETDIERDAFEAEARLIMELGSVYRLCNKLGTNHNPDLPKAPLEMTLHEMVRYLDRIDAEPAEQEQRLKEWAQSKLAWLRKEWRILRMRRQFRESDAAKAEIEALVMYLGRAYQHGLFDGLHGTV